MHFGNHLRRSLSPLIPRAIGRIPYAVTFELARGAFVGRLGKQAPEIWIRHGIALDSWEPLISDLDLTLWFEERPSLERLARLRSTLKFVSAAAPLIGETNLYVREDAPIYLSRMNPFELLRDPELRLRIHPGEFSPTRAEALVFLLRTIEADIQNLRCCSPLRLRKWNHHLKTLGEFSSSLGDPSLPFLSADRPFLQPLLTLCLDLLKPSPAERLAVAQDWNSYFSRIPDPSAFDQSSAGTWLRLLLPHRFPAALNEVDPDLLERFRPVILAQLSWELSGLYGQRTLNPDMPGFEKHVRRIVEFLGSCSAPELVSAYEALLLV